MRQFGLNFSKLYLWPRFQSNVADTLARHQPEVVELAQALTPSMQRVQQAVAVAMDQCLKELKRTTKIDTTELKVKGQTRSLSERSSPARAALYIVLAALH